jgi:hypothetical protein
VCKVGREVVSREVQVARGDLNASSYATMRIIRDFEREGCFLSIGQMAPPQIEGDHERNRVGAGAVWRTGLTPARHSLSRGRDTRPGSEDRGTRKSR